MDNSLENVIEVPMIYRRNQIKPLAKRCKYCMQVHSLSSCNLDLTDAIENGDKGDVEATGAVETDADKVSKQWISRRGLTLIFFTLSKYGPKRTKFMPIFAIFNHMRWLRKPCRILHVCDGSFD